MKAPQTYGEWVQIFKVLKSRTNDAEVLDAMRRGSIEVQTGVIQRFAKKFGETLTERINMATDRFERDMKNTRGEERLIIQALVALRNDLAFLYQCADLPAIPKEYREKFTESVRENADNIQQNLEFSAQNGGDRSGRMLFLVRNNRVNSF